MPDTPIPLNARAILQDVSPIDEGAIRRDRLARVRAQLATKDLAGIVLWDPVNIRYATGSRNMQVWTMHNLCRYAFIPTEGPVILFELGSSLHLNAHLDIIDDIRPALSFDYMIVGPRGPEMARRWAKEIADLVSQCGGGNMRLGIDRADLAVVRALDETGVTVLDGKGVMDLARSVKSLEEIRAFKRSLEACEGAIADMRDTLAPGISEQQAMGTLIKGIVDRGGEYPETRLLSSGPRTNPWFQETSDRVMQAGDLMSFDTDLIGPYGFYTDISRAWVIGEGMPSDDQRRLYDLSRRQIAHNMDLLRPGLAFLDYSDKAFQLPDLYIANRYADVAHGCGLGVDYPLIWYKEDAEWGAYDGLFEENMIVSLESYIGEKDGQQGVKLEQPVWISADGPILLCDYPLEDHFA
jgi:Xaa-Pro dipeptidase